MKINKQALLEALKFALIGLTIGAFGIWLAFVQGFYLIGMVITVFVFPIEFMIYFAIYE